MSDADNEDASTETNPSTDDGGAFVGVHKFCNKLFSKENAEYLWKDIVYVRALFGAFDGLIISYSTFKCYFDLACPPGTSSSDTMHEWMSSPLTFLGVMFEAAFIMTLSYIGNVYDEDDKNKMKAVIAWLWPYLRDFFKGLKFAYKGVRSVIQIALLLGVDFQFAFLPVGLLLGLIAATNRVWYRSQVTDPRKKYQKKNKNLLVMAQNLGIDSDYELCEMPSGLIRAIGPKQIAIAINEKENVLEYKVYDPFNTLQRGTIDLANELLYQKRFDHQNKPIPLTFKDLSKEGYFDAIHFQIAQKGHISNPNKAFYRHTISADMGSGCSTVMTTWPNDDGSNIDLGPYDFGYVRVIGENNEPDGLLFAQKNKCCSLLLSELPYDVSKIPLGDFEAGYVRVINEKKGINQLYYLHKKTNTWIPLYGEDDTLRKYDSKIYTTNVPRDLSAQELKEITSLTKSKHTHTLTTTWKQLSIDADKLDDYDKTITESCRVRVTSSVPDKSEEEKVLDLKEILIIHVGGVYKFGFCNETGVYEEEGITDESILQLIRQYQSGSYLQTKDHEKINEYFARKMLTNHSRATNGSMHALSVKQLKKITSLTKHKHQEKQFLPSACLRMSSAFFGGLVDGLYTYMAAVGLVVLCPPLLGAMLACCSLFTLLCVINRCYEEYEFQQEFIRSRLNDELVLLQKEIEEVFSECNNQDAHDQVDNLLAKLAKHLIPKHREKKEELKSVAEFSYYRALLSGLRSGLYFYSAICSVEFAVAGFCAIAMTAFPPAWIIAGFVLGFLGIMACVFDSIYAKYQHSEKNEDKKSAVTVMLSDPTPSQQQEIIKSGKVVFIKTSQAIQVGYGTNEHHYNQKLVHKDEGIFKLFERYTTEGEITRSVDLKQIEAFTKSKGIKKDPAYTDLWAYIKDYKANRQAEKTLPANNEFDAIYKSMAFDSLTQKCTQEVLEWVRSFFSGLSKGQKAVDYPMNPFLEVDAKGHYSDPPWIIVLGIVASVLYALVYAFRAFAKNWRGANEVPPVVRPNDPRRMSSRSGSRSDVDSAEALQEYPSLENATQSPLRRSPTFFNNWNNWKETIGTFTEGVRSPPGSSPLIQ